MKRTSVQNSSAVLQLLFLLLIATNIKRNSIDALSFSSNSRSTPSSVDNGSRIDDQDSSSSSFSSAMKGKMILAPLTRGGNLPFRRLCSDLFGMETSISEMIYARSLLKGDAVEKARLRRSPKERMFGVQIATNQIEEGCDAIRMAHKAGADFVDLNCGCPIYEATRRGLGSSLLRSPPKLGKLVEGLVNNDSNMPVTVKIRLGCEVGTINCSEVTKILRDAGAAAITIHGRTAQQGYSKNADWKMIQQVIQEDTTSTTIPIIGNGDILTQYEARKRMEETSVDSVMVGRGALIKPWIFQEFDDGQTWLPDLRERIGIYRTLASYMKDHFGDDEMGRKKSWNFLPWHFDFFNRYYPHNDDDEEHLSLDGPLIQSRWDIPDETLLSPLEKLMTNRCNDAHNLIAAALWESESDADAIQKLIAIAEGHEFQQITRTGGSGSGEDKVLTNLVPNKKKGKWTKRRGRNPGPKRTEEEISRIRAQRAAKKAKILAEGGVWPPL